MSNQTTTDEITTDEITQPGGVDLTRLDDINLDRNGGRVQPTDHLWMTIVNGASPTGESAEERLANHLAESLLAALDLLTPAGWDRFSDGELQAICGPLLEAMELTDHDLGRLACHQRAIGAELVRRQMAAAS